MMGSAGYRYDDAGNVLVDNVDCCSYDAENRLVSAVALSHLQPPQPPCCGGPGDPNATSYPYDSDTRCVSVGRPVH